MGDRELILGDCLDVLSSIPSGSVDCVITDPPYLISTKGGGMVKHGTKTQCKQWRENHLDDIKNGFGEETLEELVRVMKKINCYIFCSQKQIIPLLDFFVKEKKCNWNLLTWHKENPTPACGNKYLSDTEYILFFREKGVKIYGTYNTKKTYYLSACNSAEKKLYNHPTVKPLSLVKRFVENSTGEGDLILDPFMGTGTTCLAAKELRRNYIGIEVDENYYKTAKERLDG